MKKALLTLVIVTSVCRMSLAQDFPYGSITTDELKMTKYAKDTSAHAVVLREYGKSEITVANDDDIKLMMEYHVKIKIFDSKGFDEATKEIRLKNSSDNMALETVESLKGTTYFVDESGAIKHADLDPSKVYTSRDYKEQSTMKFTMPSLTSGCVIEYKFRFVSPINLSLSHFHTWYFQSDIPKIHSEYEAIIPGHFTYNAALHGFLKLSENKADVLKECFSTHGAKSDCSDIIYGIDDISAFVEEDYMTAPINYLSAITFDLVEFTDPYDGSKHRETKEWKDIDISLKGDEDFGTQLKRTAVFKDRMVPVTAGKADDLEKAKAIFDYIQHSFKWNDYVGIYSGAGVKKAYEAHSGSVADINISLIDALNSAGLNAEAVLLSQRGNGFVNELYPATNDFDYVIAKVNIGDRSYFLDATDPLLPFGTLPLRCLNGKGRVFSLDKPSYWVDLNVPQKEKSTDSFDLTLQPDGKLKGTLTRYSIGYQAYETRVAIKKFNSADEYVEDLGSKQAKLKILKSEIDNIDSLDKPVVEKYDVEINVFDKTNANRLSFNPFFMSKITTNPFKLTERSYPVDMGMPLEYRTILTIHLPAGYAVDSPPQNLTEGMPGNGARFVTDYQSGDNSFTFSHVIQLNKSVYQPEEYSYLKEFFNKVIQSERAEMIFKKN